MTFDNTNIAYLASIVLIATIALHFRTLAPRLISQPLNLGVDLSSLLRIRPSVKFRQRDSKRAQPSTWVATKKH